VQVKQKAGYSPVNEFVHNLRVRFCEVDEYGFVWHGHYLAWFEAARVEMLREVGLTPTSLLQRGYLVPVLEIRVVCKKPIKSDSEIAVHCSIEPTDKALLTFHYRLVEVVSVETCATGSTSHVLMRDRERLLYLLPDEIREPLARLMAKYPTSPSTGDPDERLNR